MYMISTYLKYLKTHVSEQKKLAITFRRNTRSYKFKVIDFPYEDITSYLVDNKSCTVDHPLLHTHTHNFACLPVLTALVSNYHKWASPKMQGYLTYSRRGLTIILGDSWGRPTRVLFIECMLHRRRFAFNLTHCTTHCRLYKVNT